MNRDGLLSDRAKRRKYGLPAELRMARLEDVLAQRRNYINDADWVNSDITLTTDAGQTPIAPGRKVSDTTTAGRRTARFVSPAPILAFFSVQSAAYAEKSRDADGVKLTVFYDPKHAFNVERMLAAMKTSLGYYRANFGPYQFDYARIVEFPGYDTFAQAFAGTIPFSERIGFLADANGPDKIDYVTYVTAHELGHQYWGHQIVGADMQGGTILVETMAQYSALMVMKHLYGEDKIRRFLKYELDNYLRSRGSERIEELPLDRVENQPYIHYRKGAVVMYLLQNRFGEDRVNAMLRTLIPLQGPALSALARPGERLPRACPHPRRARVRARPARPHHDLRPEGEIGERPQARRRYVRDDARRRCREIPCERHRQGDRDAAVRPDRNRAVRAEARARCLLGQGRGADGTPPGPFGRTVDPHRHAAQAGVRGDRPVQHLYRPQLGRQCGASVVTDAGGRVVAAIRQWIPSARL